MKNIFTYSSMVVWLCAVLACSKDLGNYEYEAVNQLSVRMDAQATNAADINVRILSFLNLEYF